MPAIGSSSSTHAGFGRQHDRDLELPLLAMAEPRPRLYPHDPQDRRSETPHSPLGEARERGEPRRRSEAARDAPEPRARHRRAWWNRRAALPLIESGRTRDGAVVRAAMRHRLTVDLDRAGDPMQVAGNQRDEGGLAGAVRPDDGVYLPDPHLQCDVGDRGQPAEPPLQALPAQRHVRHGRSRGRRAYPVTSNCRGAGHQAAARRQAAPARAR